MPSWLLAFLAVAMFASFMSTQDSYLFCWASILSRDVLGPLFGTIENEKAQKWGTRILIVVIALYELYWGLIYEGRGRHLGITWPSPGRSISAPGSCSWPAGYIGRARPVAARCGR